MTGTSSAPNVSPPQGFSGWLLLLAFGQVVGPLRILGSIYDDIAVYATFKSPAVIAELGLNVVFLLFWLFVTIAMFRKWRSFPSLWTYQWLMALLVPWVDIVMVGAMQNQPLQQLITPRDIVQTIVASIVGGMWLWYLRVSVRVKNTFVT